MPRDHLVPILLLSSLAGCEADAHYNKISVSVERDRLSVFIRGPNRASPCPPALYGAARVNGIAMEVQESGGGDGQPDSDVENCMALWYQLDVALLPADTETLDVTFDTLRKYDGHVLDAVRSWHFQVDWAHGHIWTDSDLAAAMHESGEFDLYWTPADTLVPELKLTGTGSIPLEAKAILVRSEPGLARYRFEGPEPATVWTALAVRDRTLEPTLCSGFEHCSARSTLYESLQPGGISPVTLIGVAPPRTCFAAPGSTGAQYSSPDWSPLPELSTLEVDRSAACDDADLYFAVLGACGVCGGGKSTYVIGNRGLGVASFSVRSNQETVDGGVLAPGRLSEPFEIGFDGELSALEIASDNDCDPANDTAWVASVVCTEIRYSTSQLDCLAGGLNEWLLTGMCRVGQEDGCNNLCGI